MLEMWTFTPYVDQSLLEPWMAKLRSHDIECTPHPDVVLENQTGFFPFKIRFINPKQDFLRGVDILTGFEFQVEDYDFERELARAAPNAGIFKKLFSFGRKRKILATENIDDILKNCKKKIVFRWSTSDIFELRMASLSSIILGDITDGIALYPADNIWYDSEAKIKDYISELDEYESNFTQETMKYYKFEGFF